MHPNLRILTPKRCVFIGILSLLFFCACSNDSFSADSPITLRIVTEESLSDGMNHQLNVLSELYVSEHPNVTIEVEVLPNGEDRDAYLEAMKLQGNYPDIYLLPTTNVLTLDHPNRYTYKQIEPLFPNVEVAMRDGHFADISSFYDSDYSLGKEALHTDIMNAGVVGDARYVLPLRFNIPVAYAFTDELSDAGIKPSIMESGIVDWMNCVIRTGDSQLACGAEYNSLNVFSNLIDYDKKLVTLTADEVMPYLQAKKQIDALIGTEVDHRSQLSLASYGFDMIKLFPVHIDMLQNAMSHAAIAIVEEKPLTMYPVRTLDGDVVATVSYYGAIGATCENPEAAYSFLRLFLMEESQWEINRPQPENAFSHSLLENSWPVRTVGSVEPLWEQYRNLALELKGAKKSLYDIREVSMTDVTIPILSMKIDIVRFPFESDSIRILNSQYTDAEVNQIADIFIASLQKQLSDWEGQ